VLVGTGAVGLVAPVGAVRLTIALPAPGDAPPRAAAHLVRVASPRLAHFAFVRVILAVVLAVAHPHIRDAPTLGASELKCKQQSSHSQTEISKRRRQLESRTNRYDFVPDFDGFSMVDIESIIDF